MRLLRIIMIFSLVLSFQMAGVTQTVKPTEEQVRRELEKRGLDEEEVKEALTKNGIDVDNLENATPEELIVIQQVIEELEAKKNKKQEPKPAPATKPAVVVKKPEPAPDKEIKKDTVKKKQELEIYGHRFFSLPPKDQDNLLNINEKYVLGQGDVLAISVWSNTAHFDDSFPIEVDGFIKIDKGTIKKRIYLKGLTLAQAREKIRKDLSRYMYFSGSELNVDIQSSRGINVSVYGEVVAPGSFNINATNTVFEGVKYAKGVKPLASVRKIKLIRANGDVKIYDFYKYLADPEYENDFFLDDNDLIHVPVAQKVVTVKGAVKRPMRYELVDDEGIKELVMYAGGFKENAIKDNIRIKRFTGNRQVLLNVDYFKNGKVTDFELMNGDTVIVRDIVAGMKNYVEVSGKVYNPGIFERKSGMRLTGALDKAGLMPESKTDFAFLLRRNEDGTQRYIKINPAGAIANPDDDFANPVLEDQDKIIIWSKHRFADKTYIEVTGAVRHKDKYPYGTVNSIKVSEAIMLAGGLSRDASNIAIVHRQDPLKKFEKQYIRLNIRKILDDPSSPQNITLQAFDKLEVLSENLFNETAYVTINGAVNNPDTFQYGRQMTLHDLIVLAGGFKLAASTDNIEVSRLIIKDNKPTKVTVAKISMDRDIVNDNSSGNYILEPYDNVFVRYIPDFEMQKIVEVKGEVNFPGKYSLMSNNERVTDIIKRAGGFTAEAFPEGALLYRTQDSTGYIVMRLNEAMKNYKSKFNYILKNGDILEIPKQRDFVTITGATKAYEKYKDEVASNKTGINVPYHKGKRAMFYINKYAGGVNEDGSKKNILVEHPNGEIDKTKSYGFFNVYPKVRKGSIIKVGYKKKKLKNDKDKKDVDWNKILNDSVAQLSTIMALVFLFKSLGQ